MILYPLVDRVSRPAMNRVYRIRRLGAERVPATGPVVLAANHESILDPFFLGTVTPRPVHFFAKAELFRVPLLGQVMRGLGGIPVRRGRDMGRAVDEGVEVLDRGELIGIFPQGTCLPFRNRRLQRGAARLALAAGAPLVPVLLVGTERSIQPRTHRIGFPQVTIVVGEPLRVERQEPTRAAAIELTNRLQQALSGLREPYGEPEHAWFDD
ncbi:MAG TPA: lysophospholipid acyltransferase family protein [Gaiellaceae bacterium]|nr:lysophospholipid acyltransferase family protein [Gaiellaceae bacterium]